MAQPHFTISDVRCVFAHVLIQPRTLSELTLNYTQDSGKNLKKKEPNPKLFGLFHRKGWGPKRSALPLNEVAEKDAKFETKFPNFAPQFAPIFLRI